MRLTISSHHTFVTLFSRHKFRNHCTILLVDSRFVVVYTRPLDAVFVRLRDAALYWLDIRKLDWLNAACSSLLVIRSNHSLNAMRWEHRMVQMDPALRSLTLSFVFVVIDAIDIHDSFVSWASWSNDRHITAWCWEVCLASTVEQNLLLAIGARLQ